VHTSVESHQTESRKSDKAARLIHGTCQSLLPFLLMVVLTVLEFDI